MYITRPGDAKDVYGQPCPVVVGASPKAYFEPALAEPVGDDIYVGTGFEWSDDGCTVSFCGSDGNIHRVEKL